MIDRDNAIDLIGRVRWRLDTAGACAIACGDTRYDLTRPDHRSALCERLNHIDDVIEAMEAARDE